MGWGGWRWLVVDVLWAGVAGVAIGALLGTCIGRLVVYLRAAHREALGLDEFLTLGLIGLSYGAALLCHAYGFLAVFAAGLAMRRIEANRVGQPNGRTGQSPEAGAASSRRFPGTGAPPVVTWHRRCSISMSNWSASAK